MKEIGTYQRKVFSPKAGYLRQKKRAAFKLALLFWRAYPTKGRKEFNTNYVTL